MELSKTLPSLELCNNKENGWIGKTSSEYKLKKGKKILFKCYFAKELVLYI